MSSPMDDVLTNRNGRDDEYEALPDSIRQYYSRQEYLWLSDQQKADLIQQETEPEWT